MQNRLRRIMKFSWFYLNILLHGLILFAVIVVVDWNTVNQMGPAKLGVDEGTALYAILTSLFPIFLSLSLAFLIFIVLALGLKWNRLWAWVIQGAGILVALGQGMAIVDLLILDEDWVQGALLAPGWIVVALSFAAIGAIALVFILDRKSWPTRIAAIALVLIAFGVPIVQVARPLEFSALPSVFDVGDAWAVVWATNLPSSGTLTWTGPDGEGVLSDRDHGFDRVNIRWHRIEIPKTRSGTPIDKFRYRVTSTQTRFNFANFFRSGGTVTSPSFEFSSQPRKVGSVTLIAVSDIHSDKANAVAAASRLGEFDLLLMLGDYSTAYFSEDDIYESVLGTAHGISGGVRPVFALRGNHENRGSAAWKLNAIVPRPDDSWYYNFDYHGLAAVMLDTGDDFDDDAAIYGGHAYFEEHLAEETAWLAALPVRAEASWRLAFGHFPVTPNRYQDYYSEAGWHLQLGRLGIAAMVHGHTHRPGDFNPPGKEAAYAVASDGGSKNGHFTATRIILDGDGIHLAQADQHGINPQSTLTVGVPVKGKIGQRP